MIWISGKHPVRIVLAVAASIQCIIAYADDTVVIVDLPNYVTWCAPVILSAEAAKDDAAHQAVRSAAVASMDRVLLTVKSQTSGMPFTTNAKQTSVMDKSGKAVDSVSMDLCYVVDPALPQPTTAAVTASTASGERVATLVCARTAEGRCIERLQAALAKTMPASSLETIKRWPWRYVATLEIPSGATGIGAALTSFQARPLLGNAEVTAFGDVRPPDPKQKRTLRIAPTGSVVVVPTEQGQWFVSAISLPTP
jgi:hypothetical protein